MEPCASNATSCLLECVVFKITDSGRVTYRWKKDEGEWMVSDFGQNSTLLTFTNDEEGMKIKEFFCEVKNKFSANQSRAIDNPFYKGM